MFLNLREMIYFLMIFYFPNCYVHMESLFIWKYTNFRNYYTHKRIAITTLLKRNDYSSF